MEDAMIEVDELKQKVSWNEEKLLEKLICSNSFLKQNLQGLLYFINFSKEIESHVDKSTVKVNQASETSSKESAKYFLKSI